MILIVLQDMILHTVFGIPAIDLKLDDLARFGFTNGKPLGPDLEDLPADVLEEPFKAADRALLERHAGEEPRRSFKISEFYRKCTCTLEWPPRENYYAWAMELPRSTLKRADLSFLSLEVKKMLNKHGLEIE
jgi:hypothetical protein